jgi:hypothetical protein
MDKSATTIEYSIRYNQVSSGHSAITALQLIKFQVCSQPRRRRPAAEKAPCSQPRRRGRRLRTQKSPPRASKMSSASRRKSSADDGSSAADAGLAMESGSGDDDCSPSQHRKARLMEDMEDSGVEESDRELDNGVELEGSVTSSDGPPSLRSLSADEYDDDEVTCRKRLIEDEEKAARKIAEDKKSQKRLKEFCDSDTLKRLVAEAIQEAFKSRVPNSSGGCSSKDFVEPGQKSDGRFRQSMHAPPEKFTPPRKRKPEQVAETESDECRIASNSTRTPQRKILRAPWTLVRSFSREQHSEVEIKSWMEGRANAIMDQAGGCRTLCQKENFSGGPRLLQGFAGKHRKCF